MFVVSEAYSINKYKSPKVNQLAQIRSHEHQRSLFGMLASSPTGAEEGGVKVVPLNVLYWVGNTVEVTRN